MFFEQKGPNDAILDATVAGGSTVGSTHFALTLDGAAVLGRFQAFNAGQSRFAVAAFRSGALFGNLLRFEDATRSADGPVFGRSGVVGVSDSVAGPAAVGHCVCCIKIEESLCGYRLERVKQQ